MTTSTTTSTTSRRTGTVQANGIDIHYVEAGSQDAPALVLLHGGLISTNPLWDPTPVSYGGHLEQLAQTFRVIAPDSRGSGQTPRGSVQVSLSLLADDVAALIEALELDRPAVAGFSMGGMVATILAIRHPGIARAIVNDSGCDVFSPDSPSFPKLRELFGGSADAVAADPDHVERMFGQDPQSQSFFELVKSDHADGWRAHLQTFFEMAHRWPGYGFADFASIEVPMLVIGGDLDDHSPVEDCVRAYRSLSKGELAIFPGTPHIVTAEKVAAMERFLRD